MLGLIALCFIPHFRLLAVLQGRLAISVRRTTSDATATAIDFLIRHFSVDVAPAQSLHGLEKGNSGRELEVFGYISEDVWERRGLEKNVTGAGLSQQ
jgi:hypothetical protein